MTPETAAGDAPERVQTAPLLVAAAGETPSHPPVWFMRQAGRSLPEYRSLREGTPMLEACFNPELVCEITLQPVRRHRVDAAILFSDIVVPLVAAGIGVDIVPGTGPVPGTMSRSTPAAATGTTMSLNRIAASTPCRRTGCRVISVTSSGRRQDSSIATPSRILRYSGSDRPA